MNKTWLNYLRREIWGASDKIEEKKSHEQPRDIDSEGLDPEDEGVEEIKDGVYNDEREVDQ